MLDAASYTASILRKTNAATAMLGISDVGVYLCNIIVSILLWCWPVLAVAMTRVCITEYNEEHQSAKP